MYRGVQSNRFYCNCLKKIRIVDKIDIDNKKW